MARLTRTVLVRVDTDVVEVSGRRRGHAETERHDVAEGQEPFEVLEAALQGSRLLRPGRACSLGIQIESPRTLYRTIQGEGEHRSDDGRLRVQLPDLVRVVLESIVARRRVHGRAWFVAGPMARMLDVMEARAGTGGIGRGFIVDRSSAAVTVLLVDGTTVRWARGATGEDPTSVAAVLLRRAAEVVNGAYGLHFWHLEDVASPADERRRRREAREFEARCNALIGHLPRMAPSIR